MPEVAFHTGLADKLGYACRVLRKAYRQGVRVQVRGEAQLLAKLDPLLWTFEQLEFLPHVRLRTGQRANPESERTPIWLVDEGAAAPSTPVLINLGPVVPEDAGRFERVIELVGTDDEERRSGRERWRYYEGLGLKPTHVQPAARPAA